MTYFRHLRRISITSDELDLDDGSDLARTTGSNALVHVYQLNDFADPVYADTSVTVNDNDNYISLEILAMKRTSNTLSDLTIELGTTDNLKIMEISQT